MNDVEWQGNLYALQYYVIRKYVIVLDIQHAFGICACMARKNPFSDGGLKLQFHSIRLDKRSTMRMNMSVWSKEERNRVNPIE